MSETLPDLEHIRLGDRPLAVFDVDDVVLQFIVPFEAYLASMGLRLVPRSFRLSGNIVRHETGEALPEADIKATILGFFDTQETWQTPFAEAAGTLNALSTSADIVFLTAMPPRYAGQRRRLLDSFGLPYPLIATENPKGPVVERLHAGRPLPLAFVDDMVRNLQSVADHAPQSLRLHMVPESAIHRHAPRAPESLARLCGWTDIAGLLAMHFAQDGTEPSRAALPT
ncbi:hypothetical protein NOF55_17485 [Rhizobiaceae bacterium BDR2-2]|uniref:Uncharacterized protein n=1 Tax=Ectorhizobium quercum TaxID=2965071 RepID=A0AAE3N2A4_9HYPH|nr:hypothetical protein [Ectorhizobium quercum]MCX8998906.1 hypothetical protein [Ectorhizobium quercum]